MSITFTDEEQRRSRSADKEKYPQISVRIDRDVIAAVEIKRIQNRDRRTMSEFMEDLLRSWAGDSLSETEE